MPNSDLLRHWLNTADDPLSALLLVLVLLVSAALGATLASFVTWMEGRLVTERQEDPSHIHQPTPAQARIIDRRQAAITARVVD
jgi:hypothetical protein